jgi:hypothetical protein
VSGLWLGSGSVLWLGSGLGTADIGTGSPKPNLGLEIGLGVVQEGLRGTKRRTEKQAKTEEDRGR